MCGAAALLLGARAARCLLMSTSGDDRARAARCLLMSASANDRAPACWICYECAFAAEAGAHSAGPLLRACACRGPDASFSHLPCLVKYAGANGTESEGESWWQCPTCKQAYTGELQLGLARARWDLVHGRAEAADGERRLAANDLLVSLQDHVISLRDARDLDGALPLAEEALAVERRINGDDDPSTLSCISNLASLYGDMGNHDQALPLHTEALAGSRRLRGDDHPDTLSCISNLASLHGDMGNHDLALPLHTEALAGSRRLRGDDHPNTLSCISNIGYLHFVTGDHDLALPMCEEALAGRRRVLGSAHPDTLASSSNMVMIALDVQVILTPPCIFHQ